MTATVLISGKLFKNPEAKNSRAGKPYVLATVRVGQGDDVQWWKVFSFSETASAELLTLGDGDALAVSGSFKAEVFTPSSGESRVSLSVMADRIISAKRAKREKAAEARAEAKTERGRERAAQPGDRPFNDEVPF